MVPKDGGGYREVTKSLETSNISVARRRFPQAYATLQAENKLIEQPPSILRTKVQKLLDSNVIDPEVDLDQLVRVLSGKRVVDDLETGIALDPVQEELREALFFKDPSRISATWPELVEAWAERRKRNTGKAVVNTSRGAMELAIKELLKTHKDLTPLQLRETHAWELIRSLQGTGISDKTVATKVALLKALTKAAHVQRLIPEDVLVKLEFKAVKADGDGYRSPTPSEYRVIWSNLARMKPEDQLLTKLLMFTGMRTDEAGSRYGQHLVDGMLHITRLTAPLPEWTAKTKGSYRIVPVPQSIDLPSVGPAEQLFPGCTYRPKVGKFSKAYSKRASTHLFKGLEDAPPGLVVHSLRDGFIDALRAVQCPLVIEESIVGHATATSAVHADYGEGYGPKVLKEWAHKAEEVLLSYLN